MKELAKKLREARAANREQLGEIHKEFLGYDPVEKWPEINTERVRDYLTRWMEKRLAQQAIGIAVRSLQDALDVESGDQAAHYFSLGRQAAHYFGLGREQETIELFAEYIESELILEKDDQKTQRTERISK